MAGVFRKSLLAEIARQGGEARIALIDNGPVDELVKVPPQHLMQDRAARCVRQWLVKPLHQK